MSDDTGPARMTGASTRLRDWNDGAADVPAAYTPDSLEFQRDLRALLDERDALERVRDEAISRMSESARKAGSWQGIAEGKDIVIRQIEAERDAARAEVERMREALSTAERRLESGALRIAELGDARAAYGLKEWAADARAALAGAPSHE